MDLLDKVTNWLWLVLSAIAWVIWTKLGKAEEAIVATKEALNQRITRTEHETLAASVANIRETRMTREELMEAIQLSRQDMDQRLDRISDQMERTDNKLEQSEAKTSQFRHDIRDDINTLGYHTSLIAKAAGVDLPRRDKK